MQHFRIYARLVFSENGQDAITNIKRAHTLRRSLAKSWRNARWRDMLLAFLWWLSGGQQKIALLVSQTRYLVLTLPPVSFVSPVKVVHRGDAPPDEDDPDPDEGDFDDDDESSESTQSPGETP
jgi:hypothetical protein